MTLKVWAFVVGAGFAMAGIYFESEWMIWAAIAALVIGFLLRFLPDGGGEGERPGEEPDEA
ncbi:MAG: hypothetical protein GWM92_18690 [Gemmatimonadetes bacterium]|nr:hypothetical protein [Gemmatimonadota bacterium]NIR80823.1 hypothetical protein [Gemmatimonadota bacterium]NIT89643.1 hypothetical protein [Gemmatimonadota bacterium]NIU33420.1 hypothetical protein [Gemmatimonadota bacterium]NIU37715.1 hypothetical protein [Gemmatimonadota bacterium]